MTFENVQASMMMCVCVCACAWQNRHTSLRDRAVFALQKLGESRMRQKSERENTRHQKRCIYGSYLTDMMVITVFFFFLSSLLVIVVYFFVCASFFSPFQMNADVRTSIFALLFYCLLRRFFFLSELWTIFLVCKWIFCTIAYINPTILYESTLWACTMEYDPCWFEWRSNCYKRMNGKVNIMPARKTRFL